MTAAVGPKHCEVCGRACLKLRALHKVGLCPKCYLDYRTKEVHPYHVYQIPPQPYRIEPQYPYHPPWEITYGPNTIAPVLPENTWTCMNSLDRALSM